MFIYYLIALIGFLWLVKRFTSLISVPLEQSIKSLNISIPNVPWITVDKVTESSMVLHWSSFDDTQDSNIASSSCGGSTGVSTKKESNANVLSHTTGNTQDGPPLLVNISPNTISQYILYVNGIQTAVIEGNQQSCILEGLQSGYNYQVDVVAFNMANFRSKSSPIYVRTTKAENLADAVNAEQLNHPDSLLTVLAREKDTDQIFKHPSYRQHSPHGRRSRSNTADGTDLANLVNGGTSTPTNSSSAATTDVDYIVKTAHLLTDIEELKFWLEVMLEEVRNLLKSNREVEFEFKEEENSLLAEKEEAMVRRKMEATSRTNLKSEIKFLEEHRRKAETKVTLNQNKYKEKMKKIQEKETQIEKWSKCLTDKRISNELIHKNSEADLLKLKQQVEEYNKEVFSIQEVLHNMEEDNKEHSATKKKLDSIEKQIRQLFENFRKGIDEKSGLVTNDGRKAFDQICSLKPEWKDEYERLMKEDAQAESQWRADQQKEYHRAAQIKKKFDLLKLVTSNQNSSANSVNMINSSTNLAGANTSGVYNNNPVVPNNVYETNSNTHLPASQHVDDRFNLFLMRAYNTAGGNNPTNNLSDANASVNTTNTLGISGGSGYLNPPPLTQTLSSSSFNNLGIHDDSLSTNAPASIISASPPINTGYWGSGLNVAANNNNLQIDTTLSQVADYGLYDEGFNSPDVDMLLPHALIEGGDTQELFQSISSPRPTSQLLSKALDDSSESPRVAQASNFDVLSSYSEIGAISINNNANDTVSLLSGNFLPPFSQGNNNELGGLTHTPNASSRITSLSSLQPMSGFNSPPPTGATSSIGHLTAVDSRVSNNYLDLSTQKSPFAPSSFPHQQHHHQHSNTSSVGGANEETSNAFSPKKFLRFGKKSSNMLDFFSNGGSGNSNSNEDTSDLPSTYSGDNTNNSNTNTSSHNKSSIFFGFIPGSQDKNHRNDTSTSTAEASITTNNNLEDPSTSPIAINVFSPSYEYKKSLDLSMTRGRSTSFGSSIWNNNTTTANNANNNSVTGTPGTNTGGSNTVLSTSPTGLTWGGSYNAAIAPTIGSSLSMSKVNGDDITNANLDAPINIIGPTLSGVSNTGYDTNSSYTVGSNSMANVTPRVFRGNEDVQSQTSTNNNQANTVLSIPVAGGGGTKTNTSSSTYSISSSNNNDLSEQEVDKVGGGAPSSPLFFKKKLFNFGTSPTKVGTKESSDRSFVSSFDEGSSEDDHGGSLNISDHSGTPIHSSIGNPNNAGSSSSNSYSLLGSSIGSKSSKFFGKLSTRRNSQATVHTQLSSNSGSIGNNNEGQLDPNTLGSAFVTSSQSGTPLSSGNVINNLDSPSGNNDNGYNSGSLNSNAASGNFSNSASGSGPGSGSGSGSSSSNGSNSSGNKITRRFSLAFKRNDKSKDNNTIVEENIDQIVAESK